MSHRRRSSHSVPKVENDRDNDYTVPDSWANLDEVATPPPDQNPQELSMYRFRSLEDTRRDERERRVSEVGRRSSHIECGRAPSVGDSTFTETAERPAGRPLPVQPTSPTVSPQLVSLHQHRASKFATQLYTISYLILFSILGTLARLGIQALTFYPGAPVVTGVLWANFMGCLIMGFLSEDKNLFIGAGRGKSRTDGPNNQSISTKNKSTEKIGAGGPITANGTLKEEDTEAAKSHAAVKKTVPLYIGLATGFCGSLTSFSSFSRDAFLALSNDLPSPISHPSLPDISTFSTVQRNGGYSFMALVAIIILTISLSLSALQFGAHFAIALDRMIPTIPLTVTRKVDKITVVLAFGSWLGAVVLCIWPPDRSSPQETWRGHVAFAISLAPSGCLLRFYASLRLNGLVASFPMGTFVVNTLGTMVLCMAWDLQHSPLGKSGAAGGGVVGCQVLQGVQDGFCGCLTTVSTWVVELRGLRRRNSYFYGLMSVLVALAATVVTMGSLRWSEGFTPKACV